jgi:CRISPR type IV-associated protein Csf1
MIITASYLFAGFLEKGPYKCFYCGNDCNDKYPAKKYVGDKFTNRDVVRRPQSQYVCNCCAMANGKGKDEYEMINGEKKARQSSRGMEPRLYSWVLTQKKKLAATKSHIEQLRNTILSPPNPPFSIILSDCGQKQLIFRAPVSHSRDVYEVMLEDKIITVEPAKLQGLINIAKSVCVVTGKKMLDESENINYAIKYYSVFEDLNHYEEWLKVKDQPLAKLAAWLIPNKEECTNEAINSGRIAAKNCGVSKPAKKDGSIRGASPARGGSQLYFDFA